MNETSLGALIGRTFQLLRDNAAIAGTAFALLVVAASALDLLLPEASASASNIPLTVALLFAQSFVTRSAMERAGMVVDPATRFGTLFGIGFLGNLGIILGLVLFIVPGVYLAARWFVAVPAAFGEDLNASAALGTSWQATREHAWRLAGITLLIYAPPMLLAVGAVLLAPALTTTGVSVAINVLVYGMVIIGWHAAVAAYTALRTPAGQLEQVFA